MSRVRAVSVCIPKQFHEYIAAIRNRYILRRNAVNILVVPVRSQGTLDAPIKEINTPTKYINSRISRKDMKKNDVTERMIFD
jgi:hypothetical protein